MGALAVVAVEPGRISAVTGALTAAVGVRAPRFVDEDACRRLVGGVYAGRSAWTAAFDGVQFSLGRAWYTDLELGRTGAYFADAAASDARVEASCPGLQDLMRGAASAVAGAPVAQRRGFCGPGVHVFPAGGWLAGHGGDVHFDVEGLSPAQIRGRAPALTYVLMLPAPERGGALRLWDATYEGSEAPTDAMLSRRHVDVEYATGDLLVIDSYRLHQIQPFEGATDRVSATCHAALAGASWEVWF